MTLSGYSHLAAEDFRRARRQASLDDIVARLTGRSNNLLVYDEVRQKLRARQGNTRQLKDIPLDAIVGSVGRYADFTREFLPRNASDVARWTRVRGMMEGLDGVPPIEVYQIGDAYFVADGNHRVSIMRRLGADQIQAYVTPVQTRVPFRPDSSPDQLIIAAEYAAFLERTDLDRARPESTLQMTAPGHYAVLEAEIEQERQHMEAEHKHAVSFEDAATQWHDAIYMPVVRAIRARGVLRDFPERTETDLYVWITEHLNTITQTLGWEVDPTAVVADVVSARKPQAPVTRLGERLREAFTPEALEPGPPAGQWRQERSAQQDDEVFREILVPVNGTPDGWSALEQAIVLAQREGSLIYGLHIVPTKVQRQRAELRQLQEEFTWRCEVGGVDGRLGIEVGTVAQRIAYRSRVADLVILNLAHPPGSRPIARLRSGFRTVLQRSPCPVLAVPQTLSLCQRMLLSYDGSPKAEEALFIASYLADRWQAELTVLVVAESGRAPQAMLDHARAYLESHHLAATYLSQGGTVADSILHTAAAQRSDLVLMGGYGQQPMLGVVIGSTVDQILRASRLPTLVCQ